MLTLFYDLETTGLRVDQHGIHQFSGLLVNDKLEMVESFNYKMRPKEGTLYDNSAMVVSGVTEEIIKGYKSQELVYSHFGGLLNKYVDRFNRFDKMYLAGYNIRAFDDIFLRRWFENNGNPYFGSYFWSDSLDVLVLAAEYLKGERRRRMKDFKLITVAKELGIFVDEKELHDASYDVMLALEIYKIVTGKKTEDIM